MTEQSPPPKCPECGKFMTRSECHHFSDCEYYNYFKWNDKKKKYIHTDSDNPLREIVTISFLCHDDSHTKIECYFANERGEIEEK